MMVLSLCWRRSGDKPFEAFGKDSGVAQKAEARDDGPTGPATSISPAMVRLLRPSVQLPAGTHGWRALYGFWPPWQGKGRPSGLNFAGRRAGSGAPIAATALLLISLFVCHTNNPTRIIWLLRPRPSRRLAIRNMRCGRPALRGARC